MAPRERNLSQADEIRQLIELIQNERRKIDDALGAIQDYTERLNIAAADTQQRLIGRR